MIVDPLDQVALRRHELLLEAERERLAAQLPHPRSAIRRDLAAVCLHLANWLEGAADDVLRLEATPDERGWVRSGT